MIKLEHGSFKYCRGISHYDGQRLLIDLEGNTVWVDRDRMDDALMDIIGSHLNVKELAKLIGLLNNDMVTSILIEDIGLIITWRYVERDNPFHAMDRGKQFRILCKLAYLITERGDEAEAFDEACMVYSMSRELGSYDLEEVFDIVQGHLSGIQ